MVSVMLAGTYVILSAVLNSGMDCTYRRSSASFEGSVREGRERSGRSEGGEPKEG